MKTDMEQATQLAKERERSPHSRQTSGGETSEDMSPRGSSPQQTDEPTWRSCSSLPEAEVSLPIRIFIIYYIVLVVLLNMTVAQ